MRMKSTHRRLANFRDALRALIPMAEAASMPWKNDDAYDEWESIEESLFKSFVVSPLTFDADVRAVRPFLAYGMHVENLTPFSFLMTELDGCFWRFLKFKSNEIPFDTCIFEKYYIDTFNLDGSVKFVPLEHIEVKPYAAAFM